VLAIEQGALLATAIVGGVLLGGAMSWLVLPYVASDPAGGRPDAIVPIRVAWSDIDALIAAVLGAIGAAVLVLARPIRRLRLGAVLRAGGDR
jgi:hypothetical protein